jgi:PucR C-terminal helix-turn-helix domain/GGDEF-like domain
MATPAPETLPSPRGAHLEMMAAVLAGEGLGRVAEIAARHAGSRVAVVVPRIGVPNEEWAPYERYVAARLAGGRPAPPEEVTAEVPIASGPEEVGAVLQLGRGKADSGEYLHVAALAALTELAVVEAREEAERTLRGSFLEELLSVQDMEPDAIERRARLLGCDLSMGAVGLCADPGERSPGLALATIANEVAGSIAQAIGSKVYAILPGTPGRAHDVAARVGKHAMVGISSHYSKPGDLRRALEEAELVLEVQSRGGAKPADMGDGTYRLLFRVLASHPEEIRSFYDDTVAPIVRYDREYSSELVHTLETYLAQNCNMNATAATIYAHRHTIAYRLDRIRELTGFDPMKTEDRERLGLGLKAFRIIEPSLPR